jgi:hypothetical protein
MEYGKNKMADVSFTIEAIDKASSVLTPMMGKLGELATIGGGVALAWDLAKQSITKAAESEAGITRLKGTLDATGRVSQISAGQIQGFADELMRTSTFDDEAIVNAYNAIAKYDSVPTENMTTIVTTAMDMSAAFGGDLVSNAESIGKLLESGIIPRAWGFNAALKDQITQMINAGDSAGALSLALGELDTRYGGQATAQVETYTGKFTILKNTWDELLETAGTVALPGGKTVLDLLIGPIETANQYIQILEAAHYNIFGLINLINGTSLSMGGTSGGRAAAGGHGGGQAGGFNIPAVTTAPSTGWNRSAFGLAAGGYVSGRYAITGDSLSGRRTGFEELVDFQTKRVYSAPQTQAMGAVPGYAAGSGEITLSRESINALKDAIMYGVAGLQ